MQQIILFVCIIFASLPLAYRMLKVDPIEVQSKECKEDKESQGVLVSNTFNQLWMVHVTAFKANFMIYSNYATPFLKSGKCNFDR